MYSIAYMMFFQASRIFFKEFYLFYSIERCGLAGSDDIRNPTAAVYSDNEKNFFCTFTFQSIFNIFFVYVI